MLSLTNFIFVLCTISPIIAQKFCQFNGPSDLAALQGSNYIQNVGSGNKCLKMHWFGAQYTIPMSLDSCQWNQPGSSKDQHFLVKNGNGGYYLQPKKDSSLNFCLGLDGRNLASLTCNPKSNDQTWIIQKTKWNTYTITHKSSGRCLEAPSRNPNSKITVEWCQQGNEYQQWKFCTSY